MDNTNSKNNIYNKESKTLQSQEPKGRNKRVLTGIKPTGSPHLGNYLGAIQPALEQSASGLYDTFYFIADYHALTSLHDAKMMQEWTYQVAATWMSFGLDPQKVTFYRQSDIPELFELQWILSCLSSKGLMNRAHAYKAAQEANVEKHHDPDEGINMGLFTYPLLMAADILCFETDFVPVGADQVQHVEIARDVAMSFNHRFRKDVFKLPLAQVREELKVVPGLDGRKMSKSYDNTIPLFGPPNQLKKLVARIKTDSSLPHEPKDPKDSLLYTLYKEFAAADQVKQMEERYRQGVGWGEVKQELTHVLEAFLAEPRKRYEYLMAHKDEMDQILEEGAAKARAVARPFLEKVRKAVGITAKISNKK